MIKNQKGFSHVIVPFCLLVILIVAGMFAWSRIDRQGLHTTKIDKQGLYAAKNYTLSFDGISDDNYRYQYSIKVFYDDSFDPKSTCPAELGGFLGKINIKYQSDSKAKVEVLQNVKPYKKQEGGISGSACPDMVVPSATETLSFDKKWIESGSAEKTVLVNDKTYNLTLNKKDRTISFNGEGYESTQPFLPDGLAQLYAYPMYGNCMSIAQIQDYAHEHNIVDADSKYPGLTTDIKSIPHLRLETPDGSQNLMLVIVDDYIKQLVEKTRNERGVQVCHVVASKPVYTFVSP